MKNFVYLNLSLKQVSFSVKISLLENGACLLNYFENRYESTFKAFRLEFVCLFDLILYIPSTIFQLNRDGSSTKLG